ncbi:MAG: hypothetical protein KAV82_13635 [Phycisphaerae bacterium]|nr:hypothetical protein [Phycisphaerae bacterium]
MALFTHPKSDIEQLIVPLHITSDYGRRIAEVISILAEMESRPALEILNDLLIPDADVLRYRICSPDAESGTLPLEEGISLLEGAKRSILAAACSVVKPSSYHPRMSRTEAEQLLYSCTLGQTERGSFTVAIACPLRAVESDTPLLDNCDPFTRQTTTLLIRSAGRLVRAIEADKVDTVYQENEKQPVLSANLCEALLRMQPSHKQSSLSLSITWARTLPNPEQQKYPQTITFRQEYFPIVEDVYRRLRPSEGPKVDLFTGMVDALNGSMGEQGRMEGEVTLLILHEDETVKARVDLNPNQYEIADKAHMSGGPVAVKGVLHRGRRIHRIREIELFELVRASQ